MPRDPSAAPRGPLERRAPHGPASPRGPSRRVLLPPRSRLCRAPGSPARGRTELHWELAPPRPASQDAGGGAQAGWVRVGNASGLGVQGEARPGKARRFSHLWLETKPAGGAGPSRAHGAPRGRLRGLGTLGRSSWRGPGQRSHCGDSSYQPSGTTEASSEEAGDARPERLCPGGRYQRLGW